MFPHRWTRSRQAAAGLVAAALVAVACPAPALAGPDVATPAGAPVTSETRMVDGILAAPAGGGPEHVEAAGPDPSGDDEHDPGDEHDGGSGPDGDDDPDGDGDPDGDPDGEGDPDGDDDSDGDDDGEPGVVVGGKVTATVRSVTSYAQRVDVRVDDLVGTSDGPLRWIVDVTTAAGPVAGTPLRLHGRLVTTDAEGQARIDRTGGYLPLTPATLALMPHLITNLPAGTYDIGLTLAMDEDVVVATTGVRFTVPQHEADPAPRARPPFRDVAPTSVHHRAIHDLVERGVLQGTSHATFDPARHATRGQIATVLVRILRRNDPSLPVPTTHLDSLRALQSRGIVQGDAQGNLRPGDALTRAQLSSLLVRIEERERTTSLPIRVTRFTDVGGVHGDNVHKLATAGIVNGFADGTFKPGNPVRRDQLASILHRWMAIG